PRQVLQPLYLSARQRQNAPQSQAQPQPPRQASPPPAAQLPPVVWRPLLPPGCCAAQGVRRQVVQRQRCGAQNGSGEPAALGLARQVPPPRGRPRQPLGPPLAL